MLDEGIDFDSRYAILCANWIVDLPTPADDLFGGSCEV